MWKYNSYVPKYLSWFMTPEPSAPAQPAPLFLGHGEREHPGRRVRRSRAVPKTSRKQIEWPASPKEASPCMVLWSPHSLFIFWIPQWMTPMIWSESSSFNHFLKAQPLNMKDPLFQHGSLLVGPLHIQAITLGHEHANFYGGASRTENLKLSSHSQVLCKPFTEVTSIWNALGTKH